MKKIRMMSLVLAVLMMLTMVLSSCSSKTAETPKTDSSKTEEPKKEETAAPEQKEEAPAAPKETTVKMAIASDPATLEPWAAMGEGRVDVLRNVYEYLFDYECIGGELLPVIATSYEQTDEHTYLIHLHDNVTDSKGNHIGAEDVAFSIQTCKDMGNLGISHNVIESVSAVDDVTVQLVLTSTTAGSFENIVTNNVIVSKAEYEANPDTFVSNPIGTGAYTLDEYVPGSSLKFTKRSDYWNDGDRAKLSQANVDHIEIRIIPEQSQLAMAVESGDVDIAYFIASTDVARFETGSYNITASPRDLADVILFNCDATNVFANQAVRQAVCYAIDTNVLLQQGYDNQGGICKTYGAPIFGDYDTKWNDEEYYEYDLEKAKALLAEAGYSDGLEVRLMTDPGTVHVKMAQIIQSMLGQVGIKVEILQYDNTLINTYRFDPTQFDFYITGKSSFDYITSVWKFSFDQVAYKGRTLNFYVDPELQTMLETALESKTHTPENIDAVHQYLKELALGYGLCYGMNYYASKDTVTGLALDFKSRVVCGACDYAADFGA